MMGYVRFLFNCGHVRRVSLQIAGEVKSWQPGTIGYCRQCCGDQAIKTRRLEIASEDEIVRANLGLGSSS